MIKAFEGLRAAAYRCPAGVWTIGYGHTSPAGEPAVAPGMKVTKAQAAQILARDVATFAAGVERLITVPLNTNQFSALVSFAYNVGLGNFRGSSVLKSVNAGDFDAVPRRLALWNRAGGRVLAGLVRRRAAEAALFMAAEGQALLSPRAMTIPAPDWHDLEEARGLIEAPTGKPMTQSTTVLATLVSGGAGVIAAGRDMIYQVHDAGTVLGLKPSVILVVALVAAIAAGALWIINERRIKANDDAV
jgi:lysozyme